MITLTSDSINWVSLYIKYLAKSQGRKKPEKHWSSIIHTGTQAMPSSNFSQGIGALKIARLVCLQKKLLTLW